VSNQPPTDQRADNKSKGTVEAEDKEVLVDLSNLDKKLWISSNLNPREVIEHKLGIDPPFKPIKQKERRYTTKTREVIRQEVNILLKDGFIGPIDYPSWLTNSVLVKKSDGSWRMCIDYTSMNKTCPKNE
jgi:hypothetical protein